MACQRSTRELASSTASGGPGGISVSCTQPTAARPGAVTAAAMLDGRSVSGFLHHTIPTAKTACSVPACPIRAAIPDSTTSPKGWTAYC